MEEIVRTPRIYQRREWLPLDVHHDPHGLWGRFSGEGSNGNLQYLCSFRILKYLFYIFLRCFFIVDEEKGLLFALMSSLPARVHHNYRRVVCGVALWLQQGSVV
jgi:hypothetical protein